MSRPPLDELYLAWLYSQVGSVTERNPSRSYWKVLRQLYTKPFVWLIPNDDNRAEDGRTLRIDFLREEEIDDRDPEWMQLECSMLELLIGLAQRLAFQDDGEPRAWFWHLMENLSLDKYNDNTLVPEKEIDGILDEVIWRTYRHSGRGGLFPLKRPRANQRDVELWDQMHAYLLEMD
jgi:hypothetical protein